LTSNIRSILSFYISILLWGLGNGLLTPIFPLYIRSLGFSINEWGEFVLIYAVSTFIFEWFWGVLSDAVDRRLFISLGLLSGSLFIFLLTQKSLLHFYFILQFLRGAFIVMIGPSAKALVFDTNYAKGIGLSMGIYTAVRSLGGILGPVLGSYIVYSYGYEQALFTYSLLSLTGAAVIYTVKINKKEIKGPNIAFVNLLSDWRYLFSIHSLVTLFTLAIIFFFVNSLINSYLPIYAQEVARMSLLEIGALFSAGSFAGLLSTPIFGWVSDKFGRSRTLLLSFFFSTLFLISFTFDKTLTQYNLSIVLFMFFFTPLTPIALAMLTELTPNRLMGASIGLYSTFENLGMVLSPFICSIAWSFFPSAIFIVAAIVQVIGILIVSLSSKFLTQEKNSLTE
jgi:MFS transporter, DHA1 family, multidrug resistance protein